MFSVIRQSKPLAGTSWEREGKVSTIVTFDTFDEAAILLAGIADAQRNPKPGQFRWTGRQYWIEERNDGISSTSTVEASKPEYNTR